MRRRATGVGPVSVLVLVLMLSLFSAGSSDIPAGEFDSDTVEDQISANATIGLDDPAAVAWHTPIGWSGSERLEEIVIYSDEGHAIKYGVDDKAIPQGRGVQIVSTSNHTIPEGIDLMMPIRFMGDKFLALGEDKLYELDHEDMELLSEIDLGFEPKWYSNLWNRWSPINPAGECLFVLANDKRVALYAKIPPNAIYGEFNERRFLETVDLNDYDETRGAKVCGEPIVLNLPPLLEDNGSLIVVPTNLGIAALFLDYNISGSRVVYVGIGDMVWFMSYDAMSDDLDIEVEPTWGRTVSISYEEPNEARGKDRIFLMTNSGLIHAFFRENGTLDWSLDLMGDAWRDWEMVGMWPDAGGNLIVTAEVDGDGLVVAIDPDHGAIMGNGSYYHITSDAVTMRPVYVPSSRDYLFASEDGTVYILNDRMGLDARFEVPGGLVTDVGYVGNIVNNIGSSQGNYYAGITGNTTLWVQGLTGYYYPPELPDVDPNGDRFVIVTDKGNITIALFGNETPRTAAFFKDLVENGTYEGVPVEYISESSWMMTGDPGDPPYDIPNEGAALALAHRQGAVSMITHGPGVTGAELVIVAGEWGYHEADGMYPVFGVVVEGLDVVKAISDLPHDDFNRPDEEVLVKEVVLLKDVEQDGDPDPEPDDWIPCSSAFALTIGIMFVVIGVLVIFMMRQRS